MSDVRNKLNRISRFVGIFAMIIMIFLIVATVVAIIVLAITAVAPDLVPDVITDWTTIGQIQASSVGAIAAGVMGFILLYYTHHFFTSIHKNNTPFTDECVKDLRMMALWIVVCAIVLPIVGGVAAYCLDASDVVFVFNPLTLFMALVVYFLSLVFSYGAELQKESNETL